MFDGNSATAAAANQPSAGGALFAQNNMLIVTNSSFVNNYLTCAGMFLHLSFVHHSDSHVLTSVSFSGFGNCLGGAIYGNNVTVLQLSTCTSNSVLYNGVAADAVGGAVSGNRAAVLFDSVFVGNSVVLSQLQSTGKASVLLMCVFLVVYLCFAFLICTFVLLIIHVFCSCVCA